MKILVLGGGHQGRVIATDLAGSLESAQIVVADVRQPALPPLANLSWTLADLSDPVSAARLMVRYDLVVGALPARLGYAAMRAAIEAGKDMVDVSFSAEDPLALDSEARAAGVAILPDCGLAPGLSHLLAGHSAATRGTPDEIVIYVGGVAQDKSRPYGYVVTWAVEDLLEEYVRPARIVKDGRPATVPVFSGMETLQIEGVGAMEAFLSDGLRTAIHTLPGVRNMSEKTLRWPGHVEAVKPLVAAGKLLEEFHARCEFEPPEDLVVLLVRVRRGDKVEETLLVDRYDPATGLTAMARTTALTTSAVAQWVASGATVTRGVRPLERVAAEPGAFDAIRGALERRGVKMSWRETAGAR